MLKKFFFEHSSKKTYSSTPQEQNWDFIKGHIWPLFNKKSFETFIYLYIKGNTPKNIKTFKQMICSSSFLPHTSKQQYIPLSYFCPVKCQSNQYQIKYSYKITDSVGLFVELVGNNICMCRPPFIWHEYEL